MAFHANTLIINNVEVEKSTSTFTPPPISKVNSFHIFKIKVKKIIILFKNKLLSIFKTKNTSKSTLRIDNVNLDQEEIQFILIMLRNSTFKGEHVEIFYNTVVKLQNQYINQQK